MGRGGYNPGCRPVEFLDTYCFSRFGELASTQRTQSGMRESGRLEEESALKGFGESHGVVGGVVARWLINGGPCTFYEFNDLGLGFVW